MLPKQSSPRASFDTLPNEIILHIAEHFDRRQNRHRILYVLSRVNRRLYNFAQPFLLHRVTTSCKDLSSMSRFFQETNVGYANFVRYLRIGSGVYCRGSRHKDKIRPISADDIPSFPNLRHFESLDYRCRQGLLQKLSSETQLTSLAIGVNRSILLNLMDFPNLQVLRLSMLRFTHGCYMGLEAPGAYATLTTLVIHGQNECLWHDDKDSSCLSSRLETFIFPNLRVVSLQDMLAHPRDIFYFVQRHVTLLEVNLSFDSAPVLSLPSLRKLMDGTGVWKLTEQGKTTALDDPCVSQAVADSGRYDVAFAFSRLPKSPAYPVVSTLTCPLYDLTAFAWNHQYYENVDLDILLASTMSDGGYSQSVEHFSYASDCCDGIVDFVTFMATISTTFCGWMNLRRLTLSIWAGFKPWDISSIPANLVPFLDDTNPPFYEDVHVSISLADADEMLWPHEAEHLRAEIKRLMGPDDNLPHDDNFQLMVAWEARHYVTVAREVRRLAEQLQALTEFNWYPGGPSVDVLWKWKIYRTGDEKSRVVRMVNGDLSWNNCATGNPPSIPTLVGQELVYYETCYDKSPNKARGMETY